MPLQPEALSTLIGRIYDAAVAPKTWPEVLEEICDELDSAAGTLASVDLRSGRETTIFNHGVTEFYNRLYDEVYHCTDLFIHPLMLKDVGQPAISSDLVDDAELLNSRIYREWASPQGFRDTLMAMLARNQAQIAFLGLMRKLEQRRFGPEDRDRLALIVPHVQRALRIGEILDHKSFERSIFADIVDAITAAIFVIDERGRLLHSNAAAAQILEKGTLLKRSGAHLYHLDGTRLAVTVSDRASLSAIRVRQGDGMAEHALVTMPLPVRPGEAPTRFALFHQPVEASSPLAPEIWGRIYRLTGGELHVLVGLVEGKTPNELAALYGLSAATIKTHMLNLFRKTGTRRQAELIKAALTALPPVDPPRA